jgi:hypothetical protein
MHRGHKRWTAEKERRLIEMVRQERTLQEIAREISMPVDLIQERIEQLATPHDDDIRFSPDPL